MSPEVTAQGPGEASPHSKTQKWGSLTPAPPIRKTLPGAGRPHLGGQAPKL